MQNYVIAEDLEDLYEHAPCGYASFLTDGSIIKANETFLNWVGFDRDEVIAKKRIQDFLSVGDTIFFETQVFPLIQMQGHAEEISVSLIAKDKTKIPVLTSTKQFLISDKNLSVNRMTFFNISDRKEFETELIRQRSRAEATLKSKAAFLSMLGHEIRTPLNAVIGITNLLDEKQLDQQQQAFVKTLRSSSNHLMNLLNSILDLSRIESGKITLEQKPIRLKDLCLGAISIWQARADEKELRLDASVAANIPDTVLGDPIKIGQILSNLIGNAIKFTSEGSVHLKVSAGSVSLSEALILFEVTDTGIGISEENAKHIFDEFRQAEYDTGAQFGGTGLGLTISDKLARLHGSRIRVKSKLNVGSTFSFELRLAQSSEQPETDLDDAIAGNGDLLKGIRILVADDSEDNLDIVEMFLERWNMTVSRASNGREALQKSKADNFDLVLMDLQMPHMNGYEVTQAIRLLKDEAKRTTPIIAFSASMTFAGKDLVEELPFDGVIGKPFRPDELFRKISQAIKARTQV